jgi:hypothetical protein
LSAMPMTSNGAKPMWKVVTFIAAVTTMAVLGSLIFLVEKADTGEEWAVMAMWFRLCDWLMPTANADAHLMMVRSSAGLVGPATSSLPRPSDGLRSAGSGTRHPFADREIPNHEAPRRDFITGRRGVLRRADRPGDDVLSARHRDSGTGMLAHQHGCGAERRSSPPRRWYRPRNNGNSDGNSRGGNRIDDPFFASTALCFSCHLSSEASSSHVIEVSV